MRRAQAIETLPVDVRVEDAVEAACAQDVTFVEERLRRGMSVLVECDKELALYLYLAIRGRLRRSAGSRSWSSTGARARARRTAAARWRGCWRS